MKMTQTYVEETAAHLRSKGFVIETEESDYDGPTGHRFHLQKDDIHLVLEVVHYADRDARFFLEIVRFSTLRSTSFPLDSWRFFDDRIEFKYYAHGETGMGLSFVMELAAENQS